MTASSHGAKSEVTTAEVFSDLVDRILRRLATAAERARREGDVDFMQRQLGYVARERRICTRPDCPDGCGCAVLDEIRKRVEVLAARTPSLPGLEPARERYP